MRCALVLAAMLLAPSDGIANGEAPPVFQNPELPPAPPVVDIMSIGSDIPGRMTVPVKIGGVGPYPFTIDTGAERTVISRELAARLGLKPGPDVQVTAMTGPARVGTVVIPSIEVSKANGARVEAPTLSAEHLGAPGLLGVDTLRNNAVTIDFDANVMTVRPSRPRYRSRPAEPGEIVVRAKSLLGQLVVTDASYRGRTVRVVLDTGSVVSVGNSALRRRAQTTITPQPISLTSVTGQILEANYSQINGVRVGGVVFETLPVAFADAPPFQRFGLDDRPALLLGMDALRQFRRIDIDFANREVRFALPKGKFTPF